jgi:Leucine-rich repeat (LRR) protein
VGVTRDLSNQGLREVPRSEFDRRNTEILDLSGNDLVSLQAEVRLLANLRVLDLSDNRMTNIPAELGQLSKLEVLDLSNNELTGLPYELGNLTQLRTLDLRGNSYSATDLEVIRQGLETTVILTE